VLPIRLLELRGARPGAVLAEQPVVDGEGECAAAGGGGTIVRRAGIPGQITPEL